MCSSLSPSEMPARPVLAGVSFWPPTPYVLFMDTTGVTRAASDHDKAPRADDEPPAEAKRPPKEIGGPKGPEPTRYGDWERNGRCIDF